MLLGNASLTLVNNLMITGSSTYSVGEALDWAFTVIFPTHTFARGLQQLIINGFNEAACEPYTPDVCEAMGTIGQTNPCCDSKYSLILGTISARNNS